MEVGPALSGAQLACEEVLSKGRGDRRRCPLHAASAPRAQRAEPGAKDSGKACGACLGQHAAHLSPGQQYGPRRWPSLGPGCAETLSRQICGLQRCSAGVPAVLPPPWPAPSPVLFHLSYPFLASLSSGHCAAKWSPKSPALRLGAWVFPILFKLCRTGFPSLDRTHPFLSRASTLEASS